MNDFLHEQLIEAHAREDFPLLAGLYGQAASEAEADNDIDAACFFLTQAYVFALESGIDEAAAYNRRLAAHGRDVLRPELSRERETPHQ